VESGETEGRTVVSSSTDHHHSSHGKRSSSSSKNIVVDDEFKKSEAGLLPVIIQLWSFIRLRFPWLLVYIGERPPRLNLCGQVALIYFMFIHLVLSYEISKRCISKTDV
jgi:hypothetical protein